MTEREEQVNNMLQEIMNDIKKKLPEGMGFTLLAYEFGNKNKTMIVELTQEGEDGRIKNNEIK